MNKKAIIVLALVACGLGAAATFMGKKPRTVGAGGLDRTPAATAAGAPLLGSLASNASDITSVELRKDGKLLRIDRTSAGWVLPAKGNYPAKTDPVAKLVRALLEARVLEQKTSDPALFERLSVQDVPADGSATASQQSTPANPASSSPALVSLLAKDGKALAEIVIGKAQANTTGTASQSATFAREKGTNQALLISGGFVTPIDAAEWFERGVLEMDRTRFAKGVVQAPADATGVVPPALVVERKSATEESYQVVGMPGDRELKETTGPQRIVTPLASVTIDDVAPASNFAAVFAQGWVSTLTTFDGLVFTVKVADVEGAPWININAGFEASLDRNAPAAPDEGTDPVLNQTAKANHQKAVADRAATLATEAADLQAKHSPWAYQVPSFLAEQLRATTESLLKPVAASDAPDVSGAPVTPEMPPMLLPPGR